MKTKQKKRLTESQKEIIKFLARGHYIYFDDRGKFRMNAIERDGGMRSVALAGHRGVLDRNGGAHMYRPTIESLLDSHLLVGRFDENQRPTWTLNENNEDYADEIKELRVEGALGITRKVLGHA